MTFSTSPLPCLGRGLSFFCYTGNPDGFPFDTSLHSSASACLRLPFRIFQIPLLRKPLAAFRLSCGRSRSGTCRKTAAPLLRPSVFLQASCRLAQRSPFCHIARTLTASFCLPSGSLRTPYRYAQGQLIVAIGGAVRKPPKEP